MQDLILAVDKNFIGFFNLNDLTNLLAEYNFKVDKQTDLRQAFSDIDHNSDGYIPIKDL